VEGSKNSIERHRALVAQGQESDPAATGLDLVERAAELIRATEEHAAVWGARAEAAAAHLQEEMRLAERVLEAAETRRRVAEGEVKELRARLEEVDKEYQERIDSLTKEFRERIDNLTEDLHDTQQRALRAEERAAEAESALDRIQNAMQGILKTRPTSSPTPPLVPAADTDTEADE
jgi:chromosome segregation ATPase